VAAPPQVLSAKLVKMARPVMRSAEDEIPLVDTGTYGKF
jgi:hypothetical protein